MRRITSGLVVIILTASAFGQISSSEAQKRLDELNAKARASKTQTAQNTSASAASASVAPTTRPAKTKRRYVTKPGAPQPIVEWIALQPYLQRAEFQKKLDREQEDLASQLTSANAQVKRLEGGGDFHHTSGAGSIGSKSYVDRTAEANWSRQLRDAKARVGELIRKQKTALEEGKKRMASLEPKLMTDLIAGFSVDDLKVGSVGRIGTVEVAQILDDDTMLVRWKTSTCG